MDVEVHDLSLMLGKVEKRNVVELDEFLRNDQFTRKQSASRKDASFWIHWDARKITASAKSAILPQYSFTRQPTGNKVRAIVITIRKIMKQERNRGVVGQFISAAALSFQTSIAISTNVDNQVQWSNRDPQECRIQILRKSGEQRVRSSMFWRRYPCFWCVVKSACSTSHCKRAYL